MGVLRSLGLRSLDTSAYSLRTEVTAPSVCQKSGGLPSLHLAVRLEAIYHHLTLSLVLLEATQDLFLVRIILSRHPST